MSETSIPQHIAIIMDGNGRWAKKKRLPRIQGHQAGVDSLRRILLSCNRKSVKILTVYGFSKENWKRPSIEVKLLMQLIKFFAEKERNSLQAENVRFQVIGDVEKLPETVRNEIEKTIKLTAANTGICFQLALSYGGRDEIVRATKKMLKSVQSGELSVDEVSEDRFESFLDTAGQIPPDLVIRTSGELRISNFLLWQSAYSEYYFSEMLWPDFDEKELERAIQSYRQRDRRYGKLETDPSKEIMSGVSL